MLRILLKNSIINAFCFKIFNFAIRVFLKSFAILTIFWENKPINYYKQ